MCLLKAVLRFIEPWLYVDDPFGSGTLKPYEYVFCILVYGMCKIFFPQNTIATNAYFVF